VKVDLGRLFFRYYLKNKRLSNSRIDMDQVDTILFFSNTAIGDTLFATPALNLIKKYYPNKRIIALLNPKNYKLFETNPYIDDILLFNGKWRGFITILYKLRNINIDVSLIMNGNEPQATPLAYCVGSKYIIRAPNINNEFNYLHYNKPIKKDFSKNTIYTRLKQLECIGITEESYKMEIFPKHDWRNPVKKILEKDKFKYIGIQVGASTPSRMWVDAKWISLAKKILEHDESIKIVLTGSPSEEGITQTIERGVNNSRLLNLAGKFNICSAAALLEALDLLITPDTGPLHVAAALKTPTIAISVAGVASSSNPIDKKVPHVFIDKPKTCTPCIDKRCKNAFCMDQISVNEVFLNAIKLL